jgi:uncharacterized OB-fold protein
MTDSPLPTRTGRWQSVGDGSVELLASRCSTCEETVYPDRPRCPRCRSRDVEVRAVGGPGVLFSFTIVHQAPREFTVPYAIGEVALPGDLLVLAPIDAPFDELAKGLAVVPVVGVTRTDEAGGNVMTIHFAPLGAAEPRNA